MEAYDIRISEQSLYIKNSKINTDNNKLINVIVF